jgi:putative transposase
MSNLTINSVHYKLFLEKTINDWVAQEKGNLENVSQNIIQTVLESLLQAEREEFLKSDDSLGNKANGYYSRLAKMLSGVIDLKIPRDRLGLFKPLILEIIKKDQENIDNLAFSLYSKGLSTRDINDVLKEAYNLNTSPQYISNISSSFLELRRKWQERRLDKKYYAVYIDAIYLNIRRDTVLKESVYIVMGLKEDLSREILGIYSIPQESAKGWQEVLFDIKKRGVEEVLLFVADGLKSLETSINTVYPRSYFQKCVVHLKRNVLNKLRARDKLEVSADLKSIFKLDDLNDSKEKAIDRLNGFIEKWKDKYPYLKRSFGEQTLDYYFTYLNFPLSTRRIIYTTNWIERLNKEIRKVIKNKNSFPSEDSALTLIWSKALEVERRIYNNKITVLYPAKEDLDKMFFKN